MGFKINVSYTMGIQANIKHSTIITDHLIAQTCRLSERNEDKITNKQIKTTLTKEAQE